MTGPRIPCVGVIVWHDGRLLVIRRGREPSRGLWSLPGGRVEAGETIGAAAEREALEETGLDVIAGDVVGRVEIGAPGGGVYDVTDVRAAIRPGSAVAPRAGDDADDARWVTAEELAGLETSPGLLDLLTRWGVLGEGPGRSRPTPP